jgi:hypothetical protein
MHPLIDSSISRFKIPETDTRTGKFKRKIKLLYVCMYVLICSFDSFPLIRTESMYKGTKRNDNEHNETNQIGMQYLQPASLMVIMDKKNVCG